MAERAIARGLVAAWVAASLMPLNSTMIAVAVPEIAAELRHDPTTVTQALVATYLVGAIALQSPGGRLGDRLGQWRVLTLGQAVLGTGALLGFLAPTLWLLSVSRVLMAAGGALVVPATVALIRLELPPDRRGRAFGMFAAVMSLAAGIGPMVGGELVRAFGWESIFLVNLPALAISLLIAAGARQVSTPIRLRPSFDWTGSALLTAALTTLVLGIQTTGSGSAVLLTVGVIVGLLFVSWERQVSSPVVSLTLFRCPSFAAGTLLIALLNLVMYGLLFEIPLVLDAILDLDAQHIGRLLVFMMLAMVVTSAVAGWLVDRFGAKLVALAGTLVCLLGIGVLLTGSLDSSSAVRAPFALLGMGLGLANAAAQTASLAYVSPELSGMAAGVSSTMRYLGGVVGVALLGSLLDLGGYRPAVLAQHHALLLIFTAVLLGGLLCVRFLPGTPQPNTGPTRRDAPQRASGDGQD